MKLFTLLLFCSCNKYLLPATTPKPNMAYQLLTEKVIHLAKLPHGAGYIATTHTGKKLQLAHRPLSDSIQFYYSRQ